MSFPLLLLVSLIAGLVGAMTGMGGGVVLIPALTFFGMDIKRAIAISIVSVIATSSGSASAYVRDHITNLKVGMFLEMFTMLGALVGAGITVAASERPLYLLFGIVLLASWAALWAERGTPWKPVTHQDDLRQCRNTDTTSSASTPRLRPPGRDLRCRRALPSPAHAARSLPHEGSMLRSKAIGGPSEEERPR